MIVTRNGKAVAVLLAVTDDELERLVLAHSSKFQALLYKSRRQIEKTRGVSHEQFCRQVKAEARKSAETNGGGKHRTKAI